MEVTTSTATTRSLSRNDGTGNTSSPPTYLMQLPDEVLVHIFSFLSLPDICNNVVSVCSKWFHIGQDYAVYRNITLTENMVRTKKWQIHRSTVFSIIQKAVTLTSFHCWTHNTRNLNLLLEAIVENCPHLQHLLAPHATVSKQTMQMLTAKCPSLCSINLRGRSLRNCSVLSNLKHLRVLKIQFKYLAGIDLMTGEMREVLRNIVQKCVSLEELYLYRLQFDDDTFRFVIDQTKDRIKALYFTTTDNVVEVIKHLSSCVLLEKLALLSHPHKSTLPLDFRTLKTLRNLKCLKLEGFPSITRTDNLREMFSESTFKELRVLTILDCPLGDDALLQQMAESFPLLSVLSLRGFQTASDAGLSKILTKCPLLRSIRLEQFGTWTKGKCFGVAHQSLETVELLDCDGVELCTVDALNNNSKLRVRFSGSSMSSLTDVFGDMALC